MGALPALVIDQPLADLLVGRAEVHSLGALRSNRQARRSQVGPTGLDFGEQVAEAVDLHQLELDARGDRQSRARGRSRDPRGLPGQ